jgi:hypothetical protein
LEANNVAEAADVTSSNPRVRDALPLNVYSHCPLADNDALNDALLETVDEPHPVIDSTDTLTDAVTVVAEKPTPAGADARTVIVAFPGATAATIPVVETVATLELDDV